MRLYSRFIILSFIVFLNYSYAQQDFAYFTGNIGLCNGRLIETDMEFVNPLIRYYDIGDGHKATGAMAITADRSIVFVGSEKPLNQGFVSIPISYNGNIGLFPKLIPINGRPEFMQLSGNDSLLFVASNCFTNNPCDGSLLQIDVSSFENTEIQIEELQLSYGDLGGLVSTLNCDKVLITAPDSNKVIAIDLSSVNQPNPQIHEIEVGNLPKNIILSPDGVRAYVTNTFSNTISVIDLFHIGTTIDPVVASAPVGDQPFGIDITRDGKRLLISNHGRRLDGIGSISIINIDSLNTWIENGSATYEEKLLLSSDALQDKTPNGNLTINSTKNLAIFPVRPESNYVVIDMDSGILRDPRLVPSIGGTGCNLSTLGGPVRYNYPPPLNSIPSSDLLPLSFWSFDEGIGGTITDEIGFIDGTIVGDANWIPMSGGTSSFNFNGTNTYIDFPKKLSYLIGANDDFTYETWVKFDENSDSLTPKIVMGRYNAHPLHYLAFSHPNRLVARITLNADFDFSTNTGKSLHLGDWYHVIVVFDRGSDLTLYVNGEVYGAPVSISSLSPKNLQSENLFRVGANGSSNPVGQFFHGTLDDIAVYAKALNQNEVRRRYQIGKPSHCN